MKGIQLVKSGFQFIDKNWGGVYSGGSYLIMGPKKSGRTLLGLQLSKEAVESSEVVLYFTTMRPKDLMIQAASINFDIQNYMNKNLIIVVRISPPTEAYDAQNPDDILNEYLNDIITVINQYKPNRFIFDELTPYVGFESLDFLYNAFMSTIETIEEKDIISFFVLGEPAEGRSAKIINVLNQCATGQIYLDTSKQSSRSNSKGTIKITPNVGHTEGEFSEEYYIEANSGLLTLSEETNKFKETNQKDLKPHNPGSAENLAFSNLYEYPDFILLLNNQIAMFKSTGKMFNLLVYRLDPAAEVNSIITLGQIKNSVRNSVERKFKICSLENKIIVLCESLTKEKIGKIVFATLHNLPSKDKAYVDLVSNYLSVMKQEISDDIENAEQMIQVITESESLNNGKFTPIKNCI